MDIVIVIHENRGLTNGVRWMRDERAKHGYLALCPAFLSGSSPEGDATDSFAFSDAARTVIFQLEVEQITMDLEVLVKYVETYQRLSKRVV